MKKEKEAHLYSRSLFPKEKNDDLLEDQESESICDVRGVRVLLVEDHNINQVYVTSILEDVGMHIDIAQNGLEAISALKENEYDIVLMDIQMPVMGGVEATRIIRNELNSKIPIIALTANAIKGDSDRYIAAGLNDYISKPFKDTELINRIGILLERPIGKDVRQQPTTVVENISPSVQKDSLFSLSKLKDMSRGNDDFVSRMVRIFLKEMPNSTVNAK